MACNCIDQVNEALASRNAQLDLGNRVDLRTGKRLEALPDLKLFKIDPKKRGSLPVLFAIYCPFCGTRYEDPAAISPLQE